MHERRAAPRNTGNKKGILDVCSAVGPEEYFIEEEADPMDGLEQDKQGKPDE
jgi:hypothetical protein